MTVLRQQTLVAAAWALPIAILVGARQQRVPRFLGALVLAAVMRAFDGVGLGDCRPGRLLAFPLLLSMLLVGQFAPTQGNVGTGFWRGELFWVVALFAGLALEALHREPRAPVT